MYPLKFEPFLRPMIWGGEKIAAYKGVETSVRSIGESWELSGVAGHESIVAEGPCKGVSLPELIDRYGDLPAPADSLLHIAYLRALAVSCGIRNVRQDGNAVFLVPEKLDLDVWTELSSLLSGKLRINMAQDVSVRLQIKPGENVTALLIRLLERCLELSGKKD